MMGKKERSFALLTNVPLEEVVSHEPFSSTLSSLRENNRKEILLLHPMRVA
jgi:hypothetical protein